jgi:hypothetical protein
MPRKLEDRFREKVRRREQMERKQGQWKIKSPLLIVVLAIGSVYLFNQCNSNPSTKKPNHSSASSIAKPTPIELPRTGVFNLANSVFNENSGRLRIFLRAPLSSENSPLPTDCGAEKQLGSLSDPNHHFIKILDWQANLVVATAFVRSGEMVEIFLPFGSYKLRYAEGAEWYGEKDMFGAKEMYEMTERFSAEAAKFEFTPERLGADVGAYCANGNLGRKRVEDDSQ